jgi:asparagine synthase (glutamine-hydrolysing)
MPTQVGNPEDEGDRASGSDGCRPTLNFGAAMTNRRSGTSARRSGGTGSGLPAAHVCAGSLPLAQRVTGRDRLNQMLYINSKTVLPNFILNYLADRMEMAHSVEGRVPFLDHHVAETAARVPVNMKVKRIREKHVLREAAKDVLIPEVYDRQKHPFTDASDPRRERPDARFLSRHVRVAGANDQPIYDMTKVRAVLEQLLECPADQRIAMEGGLQRVASVIILQDKFSMAAGAR